ncbi:MAG: hypothetical protein KDA51_01175 [Planctomycetales bacterium]|nr:hypothetical protein [Planctomycetales bacterium]
MRHAKFVGRWNLERRISILPESACLQSTRSGRRAYDCRRISSPAGMRQTIRWWGRRAFVLTTRIVEPHWAERRATLACPKMGRKVCLIEKSSLLHVICQAVIR